MLLVTYVDPLKRAEAARLFLDAIVSLDLADQGSDDAERRFLLALEPTGLDLSEGSPASAVIAAGVDLLWFLTMKQAQLVGVSQEELISNIRDHVFPMIYPEAHEGA